MTLRTAYNFTIVFIAFTIIATLWGCNNRSGVNLSSRQLSQQPAATVAPVKLGGSHQSSAPVNAQNFSVQVPLDRGNVIRSIENYRINKGAPFGSYKFVGADLNGDGRPEVIVYLTGQKWCGVTGCTLAVLAKANRYSYEAISTTRRVKKPVTISPDKTNGWHDIYIRTGRAAFPRSHKMVLKFNGSRYPGNAVLLTPLSRRHQIQGDEIFQQSTAEELELIRTYAASGQ